MDPLPRASVGWRAVVACVVVAGAVAWAATAGGCGALSNAAATDLSRRPATDDTSPPPAASAAPREMELDRIGRVRQIGALRAVAGGRAVVVCNGLDVDRAALEALAEALARDGFATIAYRWEDERGAPAVPAVNALVDAALAAADAIRAEAGVDPGRLSLVGCGCGGAVALAAALELERRGASAVAVATIDLVDPREAEWNAAASRVGFPLVSGVVAAAVGIGGVPSSLSPVGAAALLHAPTLHIATPGATTAPASRILRAVRAAGGTAQLWFADEVAPSRLLAADTPGGLHLRRLADGRASPIDWTWSRIGMPWAPRIEVAVNNSTATTVRLQVNAVAGGAPILAAFRDVPPGENRFTWALPQQPTDVTAIDWPEVQPSAPHADAATSAADPPPPRPR